VSQPSSRKCSTSSSTADLFGRAYEMKTFRTGPPKYQSRARITQLDTITTIVLEAE